MNETKYRRLSVIGLGYIGLPTAAMFAAAGVTVVGVDIDKTVVEKINQGRIHIVEPELAELVTQVVNAQQLRAAHQPEAADVFIIAVPTPFKANYVPDLSYIKTAVESIAPVLCPGNLIILESTSPVGTTEKIPSWIQEIRPDLNVLQDIHIAYCPERVLPGHILRELTANDRIIGGLTAKAAQQARDFYQIFVQGQCVLTDARTAEMSKLTENAFRDVNIAFANELSMICDKLDINVWELIQLANRHPRVNILQPGPGVGGHCIAVDPWFIVDATPRDVRLIRAAREVNDAKPSFIVDQIKAAALQWPHPTIVCLGLSYKANIDDVRESPAVEVVQRLTRESHYRLIAVEPHIKQLPNALLETKRVALLPLNDALAMADIIVILVDHTVFKKISMTDIASKKVIDTRGLFFQLAAENARCMELTDV